MATQGAVGRAAQPAHTPGARARRALPHSPCDYSPKPNANSLEPNAQVLNKTDLVSPEEVEKLTEWYRTHARAEVVLPISALEGENVEAVRDWVVSKMPEGPALYPKVGGRETPDNALPQGGR